MAGYLFTLDSVQSLHQCVESGLYGTFIPEPNGRWNGPAEGTFADYTTMRPGDNVYFFIDRRIYGIGELVSVGPDCRYNNFPGASVPVPVDNSAPSDVMLSNEVRRSADGKTKTRYQRWVCLFKPSPFFFLRGVDMDDALSSSPDDFRMLRAIWKLSFIKFGDEENQAFRDVVLRSNQSALQNPVNHENVFEDSTHDSHARVAALVSSADYALDVSPLLETRTNDDALRSEMALEAGILHQLATGDERTTRILGRWDYLSHQVVASPFKPIDYMDKMDLFGYAFIPGHRPTIERYLVAELKKDVAGPNEVEQTMKYVDWVKDEYAHADYSAIRAYLVAYDFESGTAEYASEFARRMYTVQRRPARSEEWSGLRLLRYRYDHRKKRIDLADVTGASMRSATVEGL